MSRTKPEGGIAAPRTSSRPGAGRKLPTRAQTENDIFALDIGTRNVVGVIGHMDDGIFVVDEAVSIAHKRRDMLDGQIEDIGETARIVYKVKTELESRTGISLSRVSIAAAGRALKTKRSAVEVDVDGKDKITESMLKSLELEAVSKAQTELDKENTDSNIIFYCVGHTVINYKLDDYQIKSLLGHKGKKASVELIAAFLPSLVVESLYTVTDMNGLEVASLTLEPIAAMNVIIPPEVRLINIALVDIGAGTTDIAISQQGSIVAYAMATIAGDEITEEIIQKYLVDFETAEAMKIAPIGEEIVFTDILGFEHTIDSNDFYESLYPAVEQLANTISENIIEANGGVPAAVFLVGGGSLIPDLPALVAERLKIPDNRVAIGGQTYQKNVDISSLEKLGPEYVTPIGIGITATLQTGYDFSQVILNGNKIRVFDTKAVTAADLLINAGFKTAQIIGRSGRGLTFTLNGEKQNVRGETSIPAQITVNGLPVTLEYTIKQGDVIDFVPATIGQNAAVCVADIAGEVSAGRVSIDGEEYPFGVTVRVNDTVVSGNYSIQNYDNITVETIETLDDLILSLPFDCSGLAFYKGDRLVRGDYVLENNDAFNVRDKRKASADQPNLARDIAIKEKITQINQGAEIASETTPEPVPSVTSFMEKNNLNEKASRTVDILSQMSMTDNIFAMPTPVAEVNEAESIDMSSIGTITVYLNDKPTVLPARSDNSPHEFLELMALADIDTKNPPPSCNMLLLLNGKDASFMDILHDGDKIVIRWDT